MKIGLCGFGVVGRGVYEIIQTREDMQVTKVLCLEDITLPDAQVTKNYQEILENTGLLPQDCLMVRNDVRDDGAAGKLGIPVFFLTDCLINQEKRDLEDSPHGDFVALMEYLDGEGNKAND